MSDKIQVEIVLDKSAATREAQAFKDTLKKINKELLTDAEVATQAESELTRKANRERIDAAKKAKTADADWHESTFAGIEKSVKSLASFSAGMVGLNSASAAAGAVIEYFRSINREIFKAGEFVQGYRKALLELAALKGQLGDTTKTLGQDLDFRSKTLQSAEDAKRFQAAALGVGESGITKPGKPGLISKDEFTKAMELGGAFQATEGGEAKAHGTLIGMIPQLFGKAGKEMTGGDVARDEAQLYKIFQPGGPEFTPMVNMYNKLAPLMGKTFDPMQGAALLSAFSVTSGETAGEEVQQFTRATLGGIDKTRKGSVTGATPQGAYYKSLGIDDKLLKTTKTTDLPFLIANKVSDDLAKQEADAAKKGEEFNQLLYLKHKGFMNQQDTMALLHYEKLRETKTLENQFLPLAAESALPTLKEATEKVTEARNVDPAMQGRKAELAGEAANVAIGAGKQEFITNVQRVAFAARKARGETSGEYNEELQNTWWVNLKEMISGERSKTEIESQHLLRAEAKRVGVKFPDTYESINQQGMGQLGGGPRVEEKYMGHAALYKVAGEIQRAGGTQVPGLEQVTGQAQKAVAGAARFEGRAEVPGPAAAPAVGGGDHGAKIVHLLTEQNVLLKHIAAPAPEKKPLLPAAPAMRR